ncbi:addiction module antidote protein [Sphingomonas bacterium]|uniref:addiction module antidote protein n=1 Tax=Sphingomonas bacterium TaxID=1895847 RepID=UPI0015760B02|nr:addiction module antidote protein [Sphingomonas bacterium]
MTIVTRAFDAARYLDGPEDEADLLSDALADGDHRYIAAALGTVARAHGGIAQLSTATGLTRAALHKALSEKGNPTLETVLKVLEALGLRMHIERRELADVE